MNEPKPGDRVRVTFVGRVERPGNRGGRLIVSNDIDDSGPWLDACESAEVLEPEWRHFDVVLDGNGATWQRGQGDVWYTPGVVYGVTRPPGDLTLIARDGKPATP